MDQESNVHRLDRFATVVFGEERGSAFVACFYGLLTVRMGHETRVTRNDRTIKVVIAVLSPGVIERAKIFLCELFVPVHNAPCSNKISSETSLGRRLDRLLL